MYGTAQFRRQLRESSPPRCLPCRIYHIGAVVNATLLDTFKYVSPCAKSQGAVVSVSSTFGGITGPLCIAFSTSGRQTPTMRTAQPPSIGPYLSRASSSSSSAQITAGTGTHYCRLILVKFSPSAWSESKNTGE